MTEIEHLRMIIGDLVVKVAQLSAQVDALTAPPAPLAAPKKAAR